MSGAGEKTGAVALAALAGEWVEAVEAAAVGVLEAELAAVQALAAPAEALSPEEDAARQRASEARREADFDNLPV